jgi:hypothetical protein
LCLLNNDAVAEPGCVERLRRAAAEADDDVGMIQPRIVFCQRPDLVNSSGVVVYTNGTARDRHFAEPVAVALEPDDPFPLLPNLGMSVLVRLRSARAAVVLLAAWLAGCGGASSPAPEEPKSLPRLTVGISSRWGPPRRAARRWRPC